MSACTPGRLDALPVIGLVRKPGAPFSTRKPPRFPSSSRAQTTMTSAKVPFPIQRFSPSSTYSPPIRRARVSSITTSEPCSGSVSANAPSFYIRAIGGSHLSFCSSLPSTAMEFMAKPECAPKKV